MTAEDLTVVIATRNRCEELDRTLHRLHALDERPQVLVVDNASTDGTADTVARHPGVRSVRLHDNFGAAGRNVGVELAHSRLVAFCDDDTWWEAGSLSVAAAALTDDPRIALVTARMLVGPDGRTDPTCRVMATGPFPADGAPGTPVVGFIAGATMVRRRAFLSCGGFSPHYLIGGEEELLAIDLLTAGWDLRYLPEVVVRHHPSASRDRRGRDRLHVRNRLWTAWLRRPLGRAIRRTERILCDADDGTARLGAVDALRGMAWVARERRVVPGHVEGLLRTVEAHEADGSVPAVADPTRRV